MKAKTQRRPQKSAHGFFSGNRKLVCRLQTSFWLAVLLALCAIGIQSYTSAKAQRLADQSYGVWETGVFQIHPGQTQQIRQNPMIETIGIQSLAGQVVCPQPDTASGQKLTSELEENAGSTGYQSYGTIGYADDGFFELACLRLKSGNLPVQANEIAVEADALGISYELNQPLELLVQMEDGQVEKQAFQLCGVLEDYSRFWNGDGSTLRFFYSQSQRWWSF